MHWFCVAVLSSWIIETVHLFLLQCLSFTTGWFKKKYTETKLQLPHYLLMLKAPINFSLTPCMLSHIFWWQSCHNWLVIFDLDAKMYVICGVLSDNSRTANMDNNTPFHKKWANFECWILPFQVFHTCFWHDSNQCCQ